MIEIDKCDVKGVVIHYAGNKYHNEGVTCSEALSQIDDDALRMVILKHCFGVFKFDDLYHFKHSVDLNLNPTYKCIMEIFNNPEMLYGSSTKLVKYLYNYSNHPKIKGGELYVVYFQNCVVNGISTQAIGIFKSENKDTFIQVKLEDRNFQLSSLDGINIKKIDKGALIFNIDQDNGFLVSAIDNTNKNIEAHYWMEEFLQVERRQDDFYETNNVIAMTKKFVSKELAKNSDISKAEQADIINKTLNYLKSNEKFDFEEFADEVMVDGKLIEGFNRYKDQYANENDIVFHDNFSISPSAVKKNVRSLKSVIKLDKNFLIHIQGDSSKLECGEDEKGKFYKMYYIEES